MSQAPEIFVTTVRLNPLPDLLQPVAVDLTAWARAWVSSRTKASVNPTTPINTFTLGFKWSHELRQSLNLAKGQDRSLEAALARKVAADISRRNPTAGGFFLVRRLTLQPGEADREVQAQVEWGPASGA